MNCLVCRNPMIPNGGIQYYHGACRRRRTRYEFVPESFYQKEKLVEEKVIPKSVDKLDSPLQKMLKYFYNLLVRIFIRGN